MLRVHIRASLRNDFNTIDGDLLGLCRFCEDRLCGQSCLLSPCSRVRVATRPVVEISLVEALLLIATQDFRLGIFLALRIGLRYHLRILKRVHVLAGG